MKLVVKAKMKIITVIMKNPKQKKSKSKNQKNIKK